MYIPQICLFIVKRCSGFALGRSGSTSAEGAGSQVLPQKYVSPWELEVTIGKAFSRTGSYLTEGVGHWFDWPSVWVSQVPFQHLSFSESPTGEPVLHARGCMPALFRLSRYLLRTDQVNTCF